MSITKIKHLAQNGSCLEKKANTAHPGANVIDN